MADFPTIVFVPAVELLVNGGFEIWQRGNGPFAANGAYSADRWLHVLTGTDTLSVSKDTTHQASGSAACAACTFVLGTGAGATALRQKLEDFAQLQGQTLSISLPVNQSVANAVTVTINDNTGTTTSTSSATTGAYTTLTVSRAIAAAATIVYIDIKFAASATVYVDNAMLVVGSAPVSYVPLTPAEEWNRCYRYYRALLGNAGGSSSTTEFDLYGYNASGGGIAAAQVQFGVPMAVTPTVTKVGTWSTTNCGQPTVESGTVNGFSYFVTATAGGQFESWPGLAANGFTCEANP